jgi:hypothetical protein
MTTLEGLFLAIGWALLRFGLPILVTVLLFHFFKRLDERWQAEAREYSQRTGVGTFVPIVRCWLFNDCPEEKRARCIAYQDQSKPCWQHFRTAEGYLKEDCLGCDVFKGVPAPVIGD